MGLGGGSNRRTEKITWRGASVVVLLTKCYLGDTIKEDEVSGACTTYGGEEKCIRSFVGLVSEVKRPFGRTELSIEVKIKIYSKQDNGNAWTGLV